MSKTHIWASADKERRTIAIRVVIGDGYFSVNLDPSTAAALAREIDRECRSLPVEAAASDFVVA